MIKERIPISGDLKSKVRQLMEYAGWQEGRKVDISIAEQYYADHGVPMMKTTQRFYRKYFGLCCEWYLAQKKLKWYGKELDDLQNMYEEQEKSGKKSGRRRKET